MEPLRVEKILESPFRVFEGGIINGVPTKSL
jgi:hypothetical protein